MCARPQGHRAVDGVQWDNLCATPLSYLIDVIAQQVSFLELMHVT